MTTPAERIRNALEMCHEIDDLLATQKEQDEKDGTVQDALAALDELARTVADLTELAKSRGQRLIDTIAERDALRAKLAEYEQAPTVAYLSIDCIGERYLLFSRPHDNDELHELIVRPRKDGE